MQTGEGASLIEIVSKCYSLSDYEDDPNNKLIDICHIAVRAYQAATNPNYMPPKILIPDTLKQADFFEQDENTKKWRAENLNDRAGVMYLRGDYYRALELATEALKVQPTNLEAFLNMSLLEWRLAKIRDDELLQRAEHMSKENFDDPTRQFVRLMIKYAIGFGFHDSDLISIGGYESSQFYPTMQKILKAVKRFIDQVRKEKETMLVPEHTHIEREDHVHRIYISNNEKHILSVTVNHFCIDSLDQKAIAPIRFDIAIPSDYQNGDSQNELSRLDASGIEKTNDSLDLIDMQKPLQPPPVDIPPS
jgi:tetratricopeptide (TPR) repeat protein